MTNCLFTKYGLSDSSEYKTKKMREFLLEQKELTKQVKAKLKEIDSCAVRPQSVLERDGETYIVHACQYDKVTKALTKIKIVTSRGETSEIEAEFLNRYTIIKK